MTLDDFIRRARLALPFGWFPDVDDVRDGLLAGASTAFQHCKALLDLTQAQGRIASASGQFLDLMAFDFFGYRIGRRPGQSEDAFRATIAAEVLRERVTRHGLQKAVADLTGRDVVVFEPWNPIDCGGLDSGFCGFDEVVGRMGSVTLPRQIFLDVVQPIGAGIPDVSGLDITFGGHDTPPAILGDQAMTQGAVTQANIFDTVNMNRAAGVIAWVAIGDPPLKVGHLDIDFTIDGSQLR